MNWLTANMCFALDIIYFVNFDIRIYFVDSFDIIRKANFDIFCFAK